MFKTQQLYQNDKRWKDVKLGNSNETIGSWGGLLVTVTMMLNGIGYNETPETVNQKMKNVGGFQGAFFIPSVLPYVWPNCAYRDMQPCESVPAPIAQIDAAVAAGKPVLLQVDYGKQGGIRKQFVLVQEKKGDDYVIYDPYKYGGDSPDKEVLLTKRYKYNGATVEQEISAVLWFDSYSASPPKPPKVTRVPLPYDKYILYAAEDDLALRAEPAVGGYLWKRMPKGTELICLEPKATAEAKLGVNGQWVHIQDPKGDQGFVAAWYVKSASGSQPLKVIATAEGIALRKQPFVSDATLIRRLPIGTEFTVVEFNAERKIGKNDQWLKVKDPTGAVGYVASWFVAAGLLKSEIPTRDLKVFLCHSSSDKPMVRELYRRLEVKKNIDPWLDEFKLLPGVDWNREIIQAVKTSDVVIVCLSKASINKEGYVQKEIRQALDVAEEKPDGIIFIIPLRVEECEVPQRLCQFQWVNYYENGAFERLLLSLQRRAKSLGIEVK